MKDVAVVLGPTTIAGVRDGRRWRRELSPAPRATCAGDDVVYVLDAAGVVWSHGEHAVQEAWRLAAPPGDGPCAVAPDGAWVFDGTRLCAGTLTITPWEIDFWERWTLARFLPSGHLALAFESSQPWSEHGSYGDRYGGVQVHTTTPGAPMVAYEYDSRRHDEDFEPSDVVWHPRGVLAWQRARELTGQVLVAPRGPLDADPWRSRDGEQPLAFNVVHWCEARSLAIDPSGRWLLLPHPEGVDVLDLGEPAQRRARASVEAAVAVAIEDGALVAITAELERVEVALDALAWETLDTWLW